MDESVNRQWLLVRRPVGTPKISDFEYREVDVPEPGSGEIRSADGWMREETTGTHCHLDSRFEVEYLPR